MLRRTISRRAPSGADVMIKSLIRMISALFTPGLDMIARMPASAARQILFPL